MKSIYKQPGVYKGNGIYNGNGITSVVIGGKTYPVVKIGNQYWIAENLDWVPDGITLVTSSDQAPSAPAACYYNLSDNGKGLLYNGYAIETINQLLPDGWHISHKSDYEDLFTFIGGNTVDNLKKIRSTSGWPSIQGTDEYGLNIYPNGRRATDRTFQQPEYVYLWTDTISGSNYYRIRFVENSVADIATFSNNVYYSIRLVKDAT